MSTEQKARAHFEPYAVEKMLPPLGPSPRFEGQYKDALTGHLWIAYRDGYAQATKDARDERTLTDEQRDSLEFVLKLAQREAHDGEAAFNVVRAFLASNAAA